jgi:orotate phosphoribosyltransferase
MQDTQIANFLLHIKAVKINVQEPFTWTSGIQSPIYCDCRIVNSHVEARDAVISKFTGLVNRHFPDVDLIAGVASGGISYGALIADRLKKPFIYIRERKKEHGLMKQIEGAYNAYNSVVLIEDLISTGGSSINAVKAVRDTNLEVTGLLSIMTYGFKQAKHKFEEAHVQHQSLCDLDTILTVALSEGIITDKDVRIILEFRDAQS